MQNLIVPVFAAALLCTGGSAHAVVADVKINNIVVTALDTNPGDDVLPSYSIAYASYSDWAGQHADVYTDPVFHFGADGMLRDVEARVEYGTSEVSFEPYLLLSYGDFYFQFKTGPETALQISFDTTLFEKGPAGDQIDLYWRADGLAGASDSDSFSNPYVSPDTDAAYIQQGAFRTRHVVLTSYSEDGSLRFHFIVSATGAATVVPEPASLALMLAGLGAIGAVARYRRRASISSL